MSYQIAEVPNHLVSKLWPQVAPIMKLPVDKTHGEATLVSTKNRIIDGISRLFVVVEEGKVIAVATIEIRTFDNGEKALYVPMMGGSKMMTWGEEMLNRFKDIGRSLGCKELRGIAVRDGWMRLLKKRGWDEVHTIIACPLTDEG